MNVKGALLWGIVIASVLGIPLGVTAAPSSIVAPLDFSTFGAPFMADADGVMGVVKALTTPALLLFAFSLMMSDFFDTMGTAMAVAKQGDFLTDEGKVEDIKPILIVDSVAAAAGGVFGASSITTFVESASGAADGGRSGLTSITAGILFLLAAFFSPLISCISSAATCGALVYVGFLMMSEVGRSGLTSITAGILFLLAAFFSPLISCISSAATCGALVYVGFLMMSEVTEIDWSDILEGFPTFMIIIGIPFTYSILMMSEVTEIDWSDILEGFPTFMIIIGIPFTYSISNGIGLGFIAYVIVASVTGNIKKIRPLMWVAAAAFLAYFLLL